MTTSRATWLAAFALTNALVGQVESITAERVRETVSWLAADERRGRDSGSQELAEVADWIVDRFRAAGLQPVRESEWFHEFAMPGLRLDSDAVQLTVTHGTGDGQRRIEFAAGKDVRQLRPSDGLSGDEPCTVARVDDPVLQRLLRASSARRPILIEVGQDDPYWRQAEGVHTVIGRRRQAARPVLLVRAGILPNDTDRAGWSAKWQVAAAKKADISERNVVGLLRGAEDSDVRDEYVVISAHYDHVGSGRPVAGDSIYNGADDNATGTTAVLLLAEALAKQPAPRRSLLFVCFAAEERGLLGSKAFCDTPPIALDQVVANLNIEMIGRPLPGNQQKAWVTGREWSDFADICAAALGHSGIELVDFPQASRLFAASDNFSFVRHGVVAHSISAGSLHQDYHQPSDEVDKLDIDHMAAIIGGLATVALELANREQPPQWNDDGRQRLERWQRRRR